MTPCAGVRQPTSRRGHASPRSEWPASRRCATVRDLPLAALPLLLGAHQIIESVVWRSGGGTGPATVAWAVIALPLLPVWVPFGVLLAAPPPARRGLAVLAAVGTATAAVLAYSLATRPVTAQIRGHTLGYVLDLPHSPLIITAICWPRSAHSCSAGIRCSGCWECSSGSVPRLRAAVAAGVRLHLVRAGRGGLRRPVPLGPAAPGRPGNGPGIAVRRSAGTAAKRHPYLRLAARGAGTRPARGCIRGQEGRALQGGGPMTDRRPHDPADAEKDHGTQVPRDLPDHRRRDGDPLETVGGHDSDEDKGIPTRAFRHGRVGGGPRRRAAQWPVHPEQPVPDEPSG